MTKYHVGVDVGKYRHHVTIQDISSDTYCKSFSLTNGREGFDEFISCLEKLSVGKNDFLIGIEAWWRS